MGSTNLEFFKFLSNDLEFLETSTPASFLPFTLPHPAIMRTFLSSTKDLPWGVNINHLSLVTDRQPSRGGPWSEKAREGEYLCPSVPLPRPHFCRPPSLCSPHKRGNYLHPGSFYRAGGNPSGQQCFILLRVELHCKMSQESYAICTKTQRGQRKEQKDKEAFAEKKGAVCQKRELGFRKLLFEILIS